DTQIGKLLDEVDNLGLRDNTVVVVWGDHGWNLGEHGLWCKHCNFETSVHSPLIISSPNQAAPGRPTTALCEFVDIYPTLCDICGLSLPPHLEGTSLKPLMDDPGRPWKPAAFSQYPRGKVMGYTMRTDRYRYTEWQQKDKTVVARELYDHQTDPGENVNIANRPDAAETVAQLGRMLSDGWQAARPPA
ncbi:MAG: sulfatase-like hydrolase/transferase, partial [Acidobacteriota bacterium]|nr:sulfatase-like hydrolase/transferase [Acidobacteriota bacterium]